MRRRARASAARARLLLLLAALLGLAPAAAIDEASELPSWGVKQKPITSRFPWTVTVGFATTVCEKILP